ncbi:MAG: hypothetical protein IJS40_04070 [Synergistaceae bacterium]|nr:hypothetical protein [Synergistaceae bacterium]
MNALIETFADFWEILTGVIDDNKAKIIRLLCFTLLLFGIAWAAINYFRADQIANTELEFYSEERHQRDDGSALKQMADLAKTVQDMREGGEAIAAKINAAHTRPFNIDGYNEMGLEDLGEAVKPEDQLPDGATAENAEEKEPEIFVRAVMTSGKTHAAILDFGEEKGYLARRGNELPNALGRVIKITPKSITVRRDRKTYTYEVARLETELEKKLRKQKAGKQGQLGVEKFLFEGTVPDDSPLGTSVKEEELKK